MIKVSTPEALLPLLAPIFQRVDDAFQPGVVMLKWLSLNTSPCKLCFCCFLFPLPSPLLEEPKKAQWAKSPKNSLKECVFVNLTLKIQCHIVKNTLSTDCFFGHFAH